MVRRFDNKIERKEIVKSKRETQKGVNSHVVRLNARPT